MASSSCTWTIAAVVAPVSLRETAIGDERNVGLPITADRHASGRHPLLQDDPDAPGRPELATVEYAISPVRTPEVSPQDLRRREGSTRSPIAARLTSQGKLAQFVAKLLPGERRCRHMAAGGRRGRGLILSMWQRS